VTARVAAVASVIDSGPGNGLLQLLAGATVVAIFTLAKPSGAANGGTLTFLGTPIITTAIASGNITTGMITNSAGTLVVSGLSVGPPGGDFDLVISNGANSTAITAGQTVTLLAAQLVGGNT
jgi:hypothetical protein